MKKGEALTDPQYWDRVWGEAQLPRRLDTRRFVGWRFDRWFEGYLDGRRGQTILEVGCAPGSSLVYFHDRWGMKAVGVDYSAVGVAATRRNFALTETPGRVVEADFFDAPNEQFDVVWSAGVVEHFDDLMRPMSRLWELTKPGGLLLTEVPNLASPLYAAIQAQIGPRILAHHQRPRPDDLRVACEALGGTGVEAGYFGTFNLMILNFSDRPRRETPWRVTNAGLLRILRLLRVEWELPWLSPYVVAASHRPP